jgi:signal transduction histidine kinase
VTQPTDLELRISFLNFRETDRALLARLRPVLEKRADSFIAEFYRHLLSFRDTRDLLRDPAVKDRLLLKQREYLLSLAGPEIDEAYIAERRRIGEAHERVGLEPRWYLGAYGLYMRFIAPVIQETFRDDPHSASEATQALLKLLILDSQIAMEAYIDRQQDELERLTDELAREGRQLARDFADQSDELRETADRARVAEELASVATLVAGLAHEIGTPMGVIQGHAKLLESAVSGDEARWRLQTIQQQIARISKIIQTLLNMARPRRRRRTPVVLGPLIETSLAFVREKLARRDIQVKATLQDAPSVIGDPERLQQLFLNLFLNAADAMPDGGELRVSLEPTTDTELEIRVGDTGAGISERDLEHIFDPFFTTKEAGEGNGLGLMVSQGIVADHGGQISVASSLGEGTEFQIVFPTPPGAKGDRAG